MTKINQFFAAVMGKKNQFEDIQCPVCGYFCTGNGGIGCIDKPFFVHLKDDSFYASLNGEISYEVRKWFAEYEPDVWEQYLDYIYCDLSTLQKRIDFQHINTFYSEVLNAQLSIQNFYSYLTEHFEEWAFKECWHTGFEEREHCTICNGTGRICKFAEAEKVLKEER